jgi:3-oxoacyl-[acyl-carrier protein] reductase
MDDRFTGRVAVVTGGARGIGASVIAALVAEGARAVSIDLIEPGGARERTRDVKADVTDRTALAAAFGSIDAIEGRIDVLVNNAGLQRVGRTESFDPETWRHVVDVHLSGMFHCTALAIPRLRRQGGAIVSLASAAGIVGLPGRGPYSAAKGAIASFTRELAVELAPSGIRVNAIAPGVTLTPLVQQGIDDGSIHADFVTEIPMRRFGTPDEIASAIRFLASDEASYITGATLVVDGGWTIQGMRHRPPGWETEEGPGAA